MVGVNVPLKNVLNAEIYFLALNVCLLLHVCLRKGRLLSPSVIEMNCMLQQYQVVMRRNAPNLYRIYLALRQKLFLVS